VHPSSPPSGPPPNYPGPPPMPPAGSGPAARVWPPPDAGPVPPPGPPRPSSAPPMNTAAAATAAVPRIAAEHQGTPFPASETVRRTHQAPPPGGPWGWLRRRPLVLVATVAAVVVVLVVVALGVLLRPSAAGAGDATGPGPLGMVAAVRPAAPVTDGVILRITAPSYAGAELAMCPIKTGGPKEGDYRLKAITNAAEYDGSAAAWFVTTGRTAAGKAAVTAHTSTTRVECTVAAGAERLLPARTETYAVAPRGLGDEG